MKRVLVLLMALFLLFGWLPSPLNVLFEGAFAIFLVFVLIKFIKAVLDMIPFI